MAKFKKALLICTVYVLVATIAIGGTYAYLTSNDGQTNVMTVGKVEIAQHEYERILNDDGTYKTDIIDNKTSYLLQEFTQDKLLYPTTEVDANGNPINFGAGDWDATTVRMSQVGSQGGMQVFSNKNAVDKFVTVENTGKTNAFVRTLYAFEVGSKTIEEYNALVRRSSFMTDNGVWNITSFGIAEIAGNNYYVVEYVYNGAAHLGGVHENGVLPAGETTYPGLCQVYMTATATNEDVIALDGNRNGKYDILVLSQAVQAEGFTNAAATLDEAFGKTEDKAVEWFTELAIPGKPLTLEEVLANGGSFTMTEDTTGGEYVVAEKADATLDLEGSTLASDSLMIKGELEVSDGKIEAGYVQNEGVAEFNDVTIKAGSAGDYAALNKGADTKTVYENVDIVAAAGGIGVTNGAKVIFNGNSLDVGSATTSGRYCFYVVGEGSYVEINGGTFSFSGTATKRAYVYAGAGTTVTINGGNFGKAKTSSSYKAGITGDGTVIIKGGTFGFDPTKWVAEGYQAVKTGSTWTVSAK